MNKRASAIIGLLLVAMFMGGYIFLKNDSRLAPSRADKSNVKTYADCVKSGGASLESYPEQCVLSGKTYVNEIPASSDPQAQTYLTIKEWGVRAAISKTANNDDLVYFYTKNDTYESVFFTFQRLINYGICTQDIGVAMSRSTAKNNPPYSIDNPEQFKKIGDYYYSLSYGGAPCYNPDSPTESAFYASTGITKATVTETLKLLEASQ